jgi:hypothetical protein
MSICYWLREIWRDSTARSFTDNDFLPERRQKILKYVVELEEHCRLLDAIIQHDHAALTGRQAFFVNNCFPVVIVAEDVSNLYLSNFETMFFLLFVFMGSSHLCHLKECLSLVILRSASVLSS